MFRSERVDVTKPEDIMRLQTVVEQALSDKSLKLWALVNNAGVAPIGFVDWMPLDSFRFAMEVNYFGLIAVTQAMLPFLKRHRGSRVVNVSSMAGLLASPGFGPYAASKHAVEGFAKVKECLLIDICNLHVLSHLLLIYICKLHWNPQWFAKALREEMRPWGVKVTNLNPAFMRTSLIERSIEQANAQLCSASQEVRAQYPETVLQGTAIAIRSVQEDPQQVVTAIATAVLCADPPKNYYVGKQAAVLRLLMALPAPVTERLIAWTRDASSCPTQEALASIQRSS